MGRIVGYKRMVMRKSGVIIRTVEEILGCGVSKVETIERDRDKRVDMLRSEMKLHENMGIEAQRSAPR